jgi:hypothetical protein
VATGTNAALLRILGCSSQEEAASVDSVRDVFRYSDQQAQLFATCRQQGSLQNAEAEWRRIWDGWFARSWTAETNQRTRSAQPSAFTQQHRKSRAVAASRR